MVSLRAKKWNAQGMKTVKQKAVPAKSSIHTMLGCGSTNIPLNRETKKEGRKVEHVEKSSGKT